MSAVAAGIVTADTLWPLHVDAPRAYAALEMITLLSAVIGSFLMASQYRRFRRLQDLLLLAALAALALREVSFMILLAANTSDIGLAGTGARLTSTLIVAAALMGAAFASSDRVFVASPRLLWMAAMAGVAVLTLGQLIDVLARGDRAVSAAYEPLVIGLSLIAFCGLLVAGFGFASRAEGDSGPSKLVAAAAYFLAAASLQQIVLPLAPNDWLTPGGLMRVAAYGLLFAAVVRLYERTREQAARDSVSAERIRIARDLHDGLAQDLAFISAHGEALMRDLGEFNPLVVAARRALATSRGAIVDLEASKASSAAAALREVAAELEGRFRVKITVRTETSGDPDMRMSDRRELVRIAREAIVNAVHHGGARNVEVTLGSRRSDLLLRIADDGCGLDSAMAQASRGTGMGMSTMRARAQALDGRLVACGRADGGTEISVVAAGPEKKRRTEPSAEGET